MIKKKIQDTIYLDTDSAMNRLLLLTSKKQAKNQDTDFYENFVKVIYESLPDLADFDLESEGLYPSNGNGFSMFHNWFLSGADGIGSNGNVRIATTLTLSVNASDSLRQIIDLATTKMIEGCNSSFTRNFDDALKELFPCIWKFTDGNYSLDPYHQKNLNNFCEWFLQGAEGVNYEQ